jgi:5-methylcytosine-specific restriction endonuclease McrA
MKFLNHLNTDQQKNIRKFYNSREWKQVRNHKIQMNPLCEHCDDKDIITPATDVDHITPLSVDFSLRTDYDNLQSLCRQCHVDKTIADNGGNRAKQSRIMNGMDRLAKELLDE